MSIKRSLQISLFAATGFHLLCAQALTTGTYFGAAGGFINNPTTVQEYQQGQSLAKTTISNNNITGGAYAGYDMVLAQHYYFGVEVFGDLNNISDNVTPLVSESVSTVGIQNDYGVAILPGFVMSKNSFAYLHIGLVSGRLRSVASNDTSSYLFQTRPIGWQAGAGVGYEFLTKWTMRLQYIFTGYGSDEQNFLATNDSNHLSTTTNQITLGIAYHFV